jgi:hypothetical protein
MSEPTLTPTNDRRRHPRFTLDLPIELVMAAEPATTYAGSIQDLSAGGCYLRFALPRDDFDSVSLSFRRALRAPVVAGRVVRRVKGEAFAVSFSDPGSELLRLISALGAITPELRADFVGRFLDPAVEAY